MDQVFSLLRLLLSLQTLMRFVFFAETVLQCLIFLWLKSCIPVSDSDALCIRLLLSLQTLMRFGFVFLLKLCCSA
jgi:hypothetical protein